VILDKEGGRGGKGGFGIPLNVSGLHLKLGRGCVGGGKINGKLMSRRGKAVRESRSENRGDERSPSEEKGGL